MCHFFLLWITSSAKEEHKRQKKAKGQIGQTIFLIPLGKNNTSHSHLDSALRKLKTRLLSNTPKTWVFVTRKDILTWVLVHGWAHGSTEYMKMPYFHWDPYSQNSPLWIRLDGVPWLMDAIKLIHEDCWKRTHPFTMTHIKKFQTQCLPITLWWTMKKRTESVSHILSSLLRGAQVMISSTLSIISAASVAESSTACFTLNASDMPSFSISPTWNEQDQEAKQ